MTEIDRAEKRAMHCLNEWVNSMMPQFNPIEMMDLKRRMVAAFREYEQEIENMKAQLQCFCRNGIRGRNCLDYHVLGEGKL